MTYYPLPDPLPIGAPHSQHAPYSDTIPLNLMLNYTTVTHCIKLLMTTEAAVACLVS